MTTQAATIERQLTELLADPEFDWLDQGAPASDRDIHLPPIWDTFEHQRYVTLNARWQAERDHNYIGLFGVPEPRPTINDEIAAENEAEIKRLSAVANEMSAFPGILKGLME